MYSDKLGYNQQQRESERDSQLNKPHSEGIHAHLAPAATSVTQQSINRQRVLSIV